MNILFLSNIKNNKLKISLGGYMFTQKNFVLFLIMLLIGLTLNSTLFATFSIVAVDTVTRQVGVAAASCVQGGGIADICHVEPDKGVLIAQAWFIFPNLVKGRKLLQEGKSAEAIIDELVESDPQAAMRQYGVITLDHPNPCAAFSGDMIPKWNGQIVGRNYSIQGNSLSGDHILKNMETAFLETSGSLPVKLMAALQAAKENSADKRCLSTSSLCACIKVANPDDNRLSALIIEVADVEGEPIDALQKEFDHAYGSTLVTSPSESLPERISLEQNYPNPFNLSSVIRFSCPQRANVSLMIHDVLGRRIKRLLHEERNIGMHSIVWHGDDDFGRVVPAGLYFCKMKAGDFQQTIKLMLVK
ncbi:DUF1028 domain-containing protein [candidate division KSB1 bacterium]|nr:DUF1028 domain-containing protein [candidate division KSB1 bacterium]